MSHLNAQVAFITGAARGIGAGTARALAERGARLILIDLDAAPLEEIAAEIGGDRVLSVACDVCDVEAMQRAAAAGIERFGGINLVLANAGVASYGSVAALLPDRVLGGGVRARPGVGVLLHVQGGHRALREHAATRGRSPRSGGRFRAHVLGRYATRPGRQG
jgi:NAD(P)-dependent dehydrogenase (short-subunit alcohol dehydrogenase family)